MAGLDLGSLVSGMASGAFTGKQMQTMDKLAGNGDKSSPAPISQAQGTPTGQQAPEAVSQAQGTPTHTTAGSTAPAVTPVMQPAITAVGANQSTATGGLGIPSAPAQQAQTTPGAGNTWATMRSHYQDAQNTAGKVSV